MTENTPENLNADKKLLLPAFLFWFFLGLVGAHYFYVGRPGRAILFIILNPLTAGIWGIVDLVFILTGKFKDSKGNAISSWI